MDIYQVSTANKSRHNEKKKETEKDKSGPSQYDRRLYVPLEFI